MDISARLQQIEELIQEAKSMPLSSSVLVNREEILELLEAARNELPEEIKQARWVVKDREELLQKARRDSEALVEKARSDQAHMLSEEAVVQEAQEEAERILVSAREHVRQMRLEAEDYVDSKLAQFDAVITRIQEALTGADESLMKVRGQVEAGRDKLRGAHPAQALAPEEAGETEGPR
jgi:cell division septum initiation protein DivIVA